MSRRLLLCIAFLSAAGMALISTASIADQGDTERVSVSSIGEQGNGHSHGPSISANGRYVAFCSEASILVPGDTNDDHDVFVHDRLTNETERVSISSSGVQGAGYSFYPSISGDGRYVAFCSFASNLVPDDTNNNPDVFVHDRLTNETVRVSVSSSGVQGNGPSGYDSPPSISADGRCVAFHSLASNLTPGDTNSREDVFVHDRVTGTTGRVSISSSGGQGNYDSIMSSISADGRYVAFESRASNLVPNDTGGPDDIFVHDRVTGATERVSVSSSGEQGNNGSSFPSISGDGRYVAFESSARNLVPGDTNGTDDIFVHDRVTRETERVSVSSSGEQGDSRSSEVSISGDGRYVAFLSWASNLVSGDTNGWYDFFVYDQATGETVLVSVSSSGEQGNSNNYLSPCGPSVSDDGRHVAFDSLAPNLVPDDTNGKLDVFVHQYLPDTVEVSAPDGWLNPGWNYFSIPLAPTSRPEASDLLGFDCRNILYQWDTVRKSFELYPDDFMDLARGRGYILRLTTDQQPSYEAYAPIGGFEIAIPEAGRILIGQPFNHDTLLENCTIRNNATGVTRTALEDKAAGSDAWINWNLVWWDSPGESWKLLSMSGGDDTYLRPWHGYNLWANVRDLTLIVPAE